jgi:hypothetical protein
MTTEAKSREAERGDSQERSESHHEVTDSRVRCPLRRIPKKRAHSTECGEDQVAEAMGRRGAWR